MCGAGRERDGYRVSVTVFMYWATAEEDENKKKKQKTLPFCYCFRLVLAAVWVVLPFDSFPPLTMPCYTLAKGIIDFCTFM